MPLEIECSSSPRSPPAAAPCLRASRTPTRTLRTDGSLPQRALRMFLKPVIDDLKPADLNVVPEPGRSCPSVSLCPWKKAFLLVTSVLGSFCRLWSSPWRSRACPRSSGSSVSLVWYPDRSGSPSVGSRRLLCPCESSSQIHFSHQVVCACAVRLPRLMCMSLPVYIR